MNKQKHRLGDVAFLTHDDGSITRTVVNSVGEKSNFGLLEHSYAPPHFVFADAVAAATAKLKEKERELESKLTNVRAQLALIGSAEYEKQVATAPLKSVSGSLMGAALGLDSEVQEMPVPSSYFEPGQKVFCVITPQTRNMMMPHYRPCAYFVLESSIREVRLMRGGYVSYRIDSYYSPEAVFANLGEGKQELVRIFAEEIGGTLPLEKIRLVSHQEEKEANNLSSKQISEQVRKQFGDSEPAKA